MRKVEEKADGGAGEGEEREKAQPYFIYLFFTQIDSVNCPEITG